MDLGGVIIGTVVVTLCVVALVWTVVTYIHDKRCADEYFKRVAARKVKPCCGNCKHTDKSYKDDPCCDCVNLSKWEAAE